MTNTCVHSTKDIENACGVILVQECSMRTNHSKEQLVLSKWYISLLLCFNRMNIIRL